MMINSYKNKIAILGTGNIGTDILHKVTKSEYFECSWFVGRNPSSNNLKLAKDLGIKTSHSGIQTLIEDHNSYDILFDATNAKSHCQHAKLLAPFNKIIIDLTPAQLGDICIPSINLPNAIGKSNINMATCGGQVATPILYAYFKANADIDYIEVISSISSKSAGLATRDNIDEYLQTTENCIEKFTQCRNVRAILNINPAIPEISMRTTIIAKIKKPRLNIIRANVKQIINAIHRYIPGYELLFEPKIDGSNIICMIKVTGSGDYLPAYAGNLDIITSAAIEVAKYIAKVKF